MTIVSFPEFNINLKISRIAFSIGKLDIYWYAILIALAFFIAIIFLKKDVKRYNIKYEDILELIVLIIPISIIFARLYYVVFNLEFYLKYPLQMLNIKSGGLAIYGGILGAVGTIIIFCKIKKINILNVLDMFVPYLALGQSIGRWGNFINGEAYGTITNNIFRMGIVENGLYKEVHPTFLYESIATFIIFLVLLFLKSHRKYKGQLAIVYLLLYSFIRAIIEGLRTDSLMFGNFRVSQIFSVILFIISLTIYIYKNRRRGDKNEEIKCNNGI